MVCEKCTSKLRGVACPDKWKEGSSNTNEGGGRKLGQNKLLGKNKRWQPYASKCKICKQNVNQSDFIYCQGCAYQKGICAMCGKQILDTTSYKQSAK